MPRNPHTEVAAALPPSTDAAPDPQSRVFWLIAASVFLIEFLLTAHNQVFGLHGPDTYWALHWTRDYSHGFVRRALLGQMLHWVHLDNTNYLVILVLSWAISLLLLILIVQSVRRLSAGLCPYERISFAVALLLCPLMGGIVIGSTGDPLQLILAIYLLLLRFVIEPARQPVATGAVFVLFGVAASLIHEASLFFIAPALVVAAFVLFRNRTARAALIGYLLGATPVIVAIVLTNSQLISQDYVFQLHFHSTIVSTPGSQGFESFSVLFHEENADRFGRGLRGYLAMGTNAVGDSLLPVFFASLIFTVFFSPKDSTPATRRRVLFTFLLPFLLSTPLYVIAHDWGRFLAYAFIPAVAGLAGWRIPHTIKPDEGRQAVFGLGLLLSGITTTSLLQGYGVRGLEANHRVLVCSILVLAAAAYLLRRVSTENLGKQAT